MSTAAAHMDPLLTPDEVAELLGVKVSTLVRWRRLRQGPPWIRVGHRTVRYDAAVLEEWKRSRTGHPLVAVPQRGEQ